MTTATGLFWEFDPVIKSRQEKRQPPPRTWEQPGFLPDFEIAKQFPVTLFSDPELIAAAGNEHLIFDIEVYPNYLLIALNSLESDKFLIFETNTVLDEIDILKLRWVLANFTTISFNGNNFDVPLISMALAGKTVVEIKRAADLIILENYRPREIYKAFKVKLSKLNHIDLYELGHLGASLKIHAGRLHCPKMQDLPYPPDRELTQDEQTVVRWYCVNDLDNTALLYTALRPQIELREQMSASYRVDLRSKSDAQIAESVIGLQIARRTGERPFIPEIEPGKIYKYYPPNYIKFQTPELNNVLQTIINTQFEVSLSGNITLPDELKNLNIEIGKNTYRLGIGGLHSTEQNCSHQSINGFKITDFDATSYYPKIVLNCQLYPLHIGKIFLMEYQDLVTKRIAAKQTGNKIEADSLKITINGSFGKFGSPYSILYAPNLVIQTTITGQLSLLLLIEKFELAGINVISANTDGVTVYYSDSMTTVCRDIVRQWELETGFDTESVDYAALYNRDVNNYLAIKINGGIKTKGIFADSGLSKNPAGEIIYDSIREYLSKQTPIEQTIKNCGDITKFIFVRYVKGGAVKDGEYLGKAIRWYYSCSDKGEIIYATTGNKVPKTDNSRPCMQLPDELPTDIDYNKYIAESIEILNQLGISYEL